MRAPIGIAIVVTALIPAMLCAQIPTARLSARMVLENTAFDQFQGNFSCCPSYQPTLGWGWDVGAGLETRVADELALLGSLVFAGEHSTFSEDESVIVDGGGKASQGLFTHTVSVSQSLLGLEAMMLYGNQNSGLRFGAGVRGSWIASARYQQTSRIAEPDNIRFENGHRVRDEYAGTVSASRVDVSMIARLGWAAMIDHGFRVEPFLQLEGGVVPFVDDPMWNRYGLRAGVSVALLSAPKEPEPEVVPALLSPDVPLQRQLEATPDRIVSPIIPSVPAPMVEITLSAVDLEGNRITPQSIAFRNVLSRVMAPVLPYVFFEEGAAELRDDYVRYTRAEAERFDVVDIATNSDIITLHYQTLNVIGYRMLQVPGARLTVVGNASGSADERAVPNLAQARAQGVKDYLVSAWGIAEDRVDIESRSKPRAPSNMHTQDGLQENQRVEFESTVPELLEPFLMQDTVLHADLAIMKIAPQVPESLSVVRWGVTARQGAHEVRRFSGSGALPADGLVWNLADTRDLAVVDGQDLSIDVVVYLSNGEVSTASAVLPVTVDFELRDRLEQYNLIVFGYNSSDLSAEHQRIIGRVRTLMGPKAGVKIIGYADRTGDPVLNEELSRRRAIAVARELGVPESVASGVGSSELLFDNDTPEGRFFCRTVRIFVRSAID